MLTIDVTVPPSVNHCYRRVKRRSKQTGKVYLADQLTAEAETWLEECALRARVACRRAGWAVTPKGTKVVIELRVFWKDARTRDTHNLHKLVADGLEGVVYENDSFALLRDMDFAIDRKRPRVELTWYLLEEEAA